MRALDVYDRVSWRLTIKEPDAPQPLRGFGLQIPCFGC
jgi:hypothetical protein